jgi:hypothetical protein
VHRDTQPVSLRCPPLLLLLLLLCQCLQEMGYNAVHFNQLAHSWLRDVRIHNSDSGFYSWGMVFCTITGLEITSGDR